MKAVTINVQISKCPRQYESVRLGGEWTVEKGETPEQVMEQALALLNQFYADSQKPKAEVQAAAKNDAETAETPAKTEDGKEILIFERDSAKVQSICKRIEKGVSLDTVLQYFAPDKEALKVLRLAAKLNEETPSTEAAASK